MVSASFAPVLVSALLLSSSCQPSMSDRVAWLPTVSAPTIHPIVVVRGELSLTDKSRLKTPMGMVINPGWGAPGPVELTGAREKALPERLALTWFSFTEDVFYTGQFELPTIAIAKAFAEGLTSPATGKHRTYEQIIVGMAPGGAVVLWLSAEGVTREVARYQAVKAEEPWRVVLDNPRVSRAQYIEKVLTQRLAESDRERLARNGVSPDWWMLVAARYQLTTVVVGGNLRTSLWVDYLNGEREYLDLSLPAPVTITGRAAPHRAVVRWTAQSGQAYSATITLDEDEVVAALRKLTAANPAAPISLVIDVGRAPEKLAVSVRDKQFLLEFKKVLAQYYSE